MLNQLQLQNLSAVALKNGDFVPALEEYINYIKTQNKTKLIIEIKGTNKGKAIADSVVHLVHRAWIRLLETPSASSLDAARKGIAFHMYGQRGVQGQAARHVHGVSSSRNSTIRPGDSSRRTVTPAAKSATPRTTPFPGAAAPGAPGAPGVPGERRDRIGRDAKVKTFRSFCQFSGPGDASVRQYVLADEFAFNQEDLFAAQCGGHGRCAW